MYNVNRNRKCFFWSILVFWSFYSAAAPAYAELNGSTNKPQLVNAAELTQRLNDLSLKSFNREPGTLNEAEQIELLAKHLPVSNEALTIQVRSICMQAYILDHQQKFDEALRRLKKAEAIPLPTNAFGRGSIYYMYGAVSDSTGDYGQALINYSRAYDIYVAHDDQLNQSVVLGQIGRLYKLVEQYERAIEYLSQADAIVETRESTLIAVNLNLGNSLLQLGHYESAEQAFNKALTVAEKSGFPRYVMNAQLYLTELKMEMQDMESSKQHFELALQLLQQQGKTKDAEFHRLEALFSYQIDDLEAAKVSVELMFVDKSLDSTSVLERNLHKTAIKIYSALGDYQPAYHHLTALKRIIIEQMKMAANAEGSFQSAKFAFEQKEQELTFQAELIEKQSKIIWTVSILITVAILVAIIIALVATIIGKLLVKNKHINNELQNTITQLNQAQDQLVESKKMASLGRLVAGVAHELNTPIGISMTAASTIGDDAVKYESLVNENKLKKSELLGFLTRLKELDDLVCDNLSRCHQVIQNFKLLSSDQVVAELRPTYLKDFVSEVMTNLSTSLKHHKVVCDIAGDNPLVNIDSNMMSQIIDNLTTNAIEHGFENLSNKKIEINICSKEGVAQLQFKDSGIGMETSSCSQVFEPFYTTKRAEGKVGLGMNIVYNLVTEKFDGTISVKSEKNKGTVFTITLPS